MNWDTIEGQWKQFKGQVKSKWAKLTDDDMAMMSGKKHALVGKIQERYGLVRDEAERQVDEWMAKLSPSHETRESQDARDRASQGGAPQRGTDASRR